MPFQTLPTLPRYGGLLGVEPDQLYQFMATSVTFLVGHDRAEFSVNPGLVSGLSASLNALVKGGTEESLERRVICEDVDKDVFSRFVQFVYTGTYKGFAPTEREGLANHSEGVTETALFGAIDENDAFKLPYSLVSYTKAATNRTSPLFGGPLRFDTMACDCCPSQKKRDFVSAFVRKHCDIWGQSGSTPETMSVEHVFLGHARVWAFANRFAIAPLMNLAYSQLARELAQSTISESAFVPEFGGLVRYVYGNCAAGSQLRGLVAEFAACVVEDVSGLEGWSMLLEEVPAFVVDLVRQMMNRFG